MAAKNPRLSTIVEPGILGWVRRRAKAEGTSLSSALRDILREAYELSEDAHWVHVGEERLASFRRKDALAHAAVWKGRT